MKILSSNKKARFDYEIVEEYSAGIKLEGREIKSLRNQKPAFAGSYVTITNGKPILHDLSIPRYKHDPSPDYEPKRERLLLLKQSEINRIQGKLNEQGVTVVPIAIGLERQWAKVTIAIVRGKKQHDKRQTIRDREDKRKMQRVMKQY
jgi:SsrA-binding protein